MNRLVHFSARGALGLSMIPVLGLLLSCTPQLKQSQFTIANVITRVTDVSGNIVATLQSGDAPAVSGGPTTTVSGIVAMVNGGSAQVGITGSAQFVTILVASPGMTDYYQLTLPASVLQSGLILQASAALGDEILPINYAVVSNGAVGPYASQSMRILHVGTGDVQVSVAWTGASDVDLHVVDPNGEEIYYAHKTSVSGGTLDLDSNPACSIDNKNNENIVWAPGKGIAGNYTVRVDYYDSCTVAQSDYVVTVHTVTGTSNVFTGSFTGLGDKGGQGSGQLITTFTY